MDSKYLGKALNLPKEPHAKLEQVRAILTERWGFKLSLSDTVAHMAADFLKRHEEEKAAIELQEGKK